MIVYECRQDKCNVRVRDTIPLDVQAHQITPHPILDQVVKGEPIRLEVIS